MVESGHSDFFIIPEGLDFINSLLVFLFIAFIIVELGYLMIPEFGKSYIERIDFDKKTGGAVSLTGMLSYSVLALIVILQI